MGNYLVWIGNNSFEVYGSECAFEIYKKALPFSEVLCMKVVLVDGSTGEVIEESEND